MALLPTPPIADLREGAPWNKSSHFKYLPPALPKRRQTRCCYRALNRLQTHVADVNNIMCARPVAAGEADLASVDPRCPRREERRASATSWPGLSRPSTSLSHNESK